MQQSKLEIAKNIKESKAENSSPAYSFAYRLSQAFDYVAILRPLLLIPVWTMVLLGYYRAIKSDLTTQIQLPFFDNIGFIFRPHQEILITLLLYSLLMGAIYILNQLTDSKTDSINGKLYLIHDGHLKKNRMKVQIAILLIFSIVLSFLKFPIVYSLLILLSMIMGIAYSVPPIRLKGRPILDLLANASGFGIIAFSVGWMSKASFSSDLILDSIPYFLCISSGFINTTIPDMEGDVRNGDRTTGVFLGIQKSCLVSTLILILAIIAGIYRRDLVPLVASAISLPFFIYMTVSNWGNKTNIKAISLATKISVLTLSLLVSFLIPLYLVMLVLTILLVRLYYQVRFGINYP
jgi:4-hydroxybenzoate polyprenyltransferase